MIEALSALDGIQTPGTIRRLPFRWAASDDWKDTVMRPAPRARERDGAGDDRQPRHEVPQYQFPGDELAAKRATREGHCPSCVFLEPGAPSRGT